MKMGLLKASLLFGLLFSVAVLASARQLVETESDVEESKFHGHGPGGHHPPTTERKTPETSSSVNPDSYHGHHGGHDNDHHHGGHDYDHHHGGHDYDHHHGGQGYHHPPQVKGN